MLTRRSLILRGIAALAAAPLVLAAAPAAAKGAVRGKSGKPAPAKARPIWIGHR